MCASKVQSHRARFEGHLLLFWGCGWDLLSVGSRVMDGIGTARRCIGKEERAMLSQVTGDDHIRIVDGHAAAEGPGYTSFRQQAAKTCHVL